MVKAEWNSAMDAVMVSSLERTDWKNECLKVDIAAASKGGTECNKSE